VRQRREDDDVAERELQAVIEMADENTTLLGATAARTSWAAWASEGGQSRAVSRGQSVAPGLGVVGPLVEVGTVVLLLAVDLVAV
jgi:hypothetical protein